MIVRISGEDQYRLDPAHDGRLNELDSDVLAAVDAGDEERFRDAFTRCSSSCAPTAQPSPTTISRAPT